MNTSQILTRVNEALRLCRENDSPALTLVNLAEALEAQLRQEAAASKGNASALKIITAICKSQRDTRTALGWAWIDAEGRQCVCDGLQAYRMRDHLPLEERPVNAGEPINLDRIFPKSIDGWSKLAIPGTKELRGFIATEKAKWQALPRTKRPAFIPQWDFENGPSVNAELLLNAATLFPNAAELFWINTVSPLVITCEEGDALLMPIRVTGRTEPKPTEEQAKANEAYNEQRKEAQAEADAESAKRRKARQDEEAARQESIRAHVHYLEAMAKAEKAKDRGDKASAMDEAVAAAEREADSRLREYAARTVYDAGYSMTLDDFVTITNGLYLRENIAKAS